MMLWERLFTNKRLKSGVTSGATQTDESRNSFQRDYDRIIFSAPFRRLQDKTQVFPLLGPIFVHNRLTHSLEVASVGRSLGQRVGIEIAKQATLSTGASTFYLQDLSTVIAAACLAHDMGNPPFGHSGEDAIRAYFQSPSPAIQQRLDTLSDLEMEDLRIYEGNSMAFRMIAQQGQGYHANFNLTMTTMAALIKYPCDSQEGFNKSAGKICLKKSGYFQSDAAAFAQIAAQFELPAIEGTNSAYARHPFVFLTEAADDICYRIIDVEDAHRLGIVEESKVKSLFLPFFEHGTGHYALAQVERVYASINTAEERIAYLRATWIGFMVEQCAQVFMATEEDILRGELNVSLIDLLPYKALFEELNDYSVSKIYQYPNSMEIEIAGFKILGVILEELLMATFKPHLAKSKKIIQLLNWQSLLDHHVKTAYEQCMLAIDFVSSMTDSYAIDLYRKLQGVKLYVN